MNFIIVLHVVEVQVFDLHFVNVVKKYAFVPKHVKYQDGMIFIDMNVKHQMKVVQKIDQV
jgi:hypothetical protein